MLPEPVEFTQDRGGEWHFASTALPLKTVIDVHGLKFMFITPHESSGVVSIALDDKVVRYDRVATDPHGHWICLLRLGPGDMEEPLNADG